jgi:hypothetical protein
MESLGKFHDPFLAEIARQPDDSRRVNVPITLLAGRGVDASLVDAAQLLGDQSGRLTLASKVTA